MAAILRVTDINVGSILHLARVARLASIDHDHPFGITRDSKRYGISLIRFLQSNGRHDQMLMRVDCPRLVRLGSTDYDTIRAYIHHVYIHVRIFLL